MSDHVDPWPPEFDAVACAEAFHRVALENQHVRVLETVIQPGETVPMHTHQWPIVSYLLSFSDTVRRNGDGEVTYDSRLISDKPVVGQAFWMGPITLHTLENVGENPFHVITVEIKPSQA